MSNGQISIEKLPGHLKIIVQGDDPTHPWEMVLTPKAAFDLGLVLRDTALQLGHYTQIPVQSQSGAQPARRPPTTQFRRNQTSAETGPQTSVDGTPQSFSPRPTQTIPPDGGPLLDDNFGLSVP